MSKGSVSFNHPSVHTDDGRPMKAALVALQHGYRTLPWFVAGTVTRDELALVVEEAVNDLAVNQCDRLAMTDGEALEPMRPRRSSFAAMSASP